jgi:glycosyltransferase involved in cell wall biosynthesis
LKSKTKVTVTIPTYNRAHLLNVALKSVLEQDFPDFQVIILDNASTDDTESVISSYNDSRITYLSNKTNIGLFRNWNRAIEVNDSPYIVILQDDDIMLPGFIQESVVALDQHPQAAFSFTKSRFIDIDGSLLQAQDNGYGTKGLIDGLNYLHQIVAGYNWVIHISSTMMRASALTEVGPFDILHQKHAMEFNLHFRLAAYFDLFHIPKELARIRLHSGQDHTITTPETGPLGMVADRTDAIAYLMQSRRASCESYRLWLAKRLLYIGRLRSEYTSHLIPNINLTRTERFEIAVQEIKDLIPANESFIFVDEASFGNQVFPGRRSLPFIEKNGEYFGPPPDDETAIRELERMRRSGVEFIVFAWPSFWWLDYYSELRNYLNKKFCCIHNNSRIISFDMTRRPMNNKVLIKTI